MHRRVHRPDGREATCWSPAGSMPRSARRLGPFARCRDTVPAPSIGLPIDAAGVGPSGIWLDLQYNALTAGVEVFQMQQDGVIPPDQLRRLAATAISEGRLPADSLVHGSPFAAHHDTTCLLCRLAFAGEPVQLLVGQNRVALLHVRSSARGWTSSGRTTEPMTAATAAKRSTTTA